MHEDGTNATVTERLEGRFGETLRPARSPPSLLQACSLTPTLTPCTRRSNG
jgi:hypothetical protein